MVIFGAGFSKAVHDTFPVLSKLAKDVLPHLEDHAAPSTRPLVDELRRGTELADATPAGTDCQPTVDFEGWLSRIAVDQPHLSLAENYERRALFAQAATAIRRVLLDATETAFSKGLPSSTWLYELLRVLDVRRATVITMNYDTIIELVAPDALWPWLPIPTPSGFDGASPLVASDLFGGLPPTVPTPVDTVLVPTLGDPVTIPRPPPETLRLIKLHGSLDWFAARGDPTGATLIRWESKGRSNTNDHPPGREPFLVPPDANKSSYFDNPLVRELWAQARLALERAKSVTLVGYSLPATDTTFGGLLADTIGAREVPVIVVNRKPEPVINRLRVLGVSPAREHGGAGAVEAWTAALVDEQARLTTDCLRDLAALPRADESIWNATVSIGPWNRLDLRTSRYVMPGRMVDDTFVLELWPSSEREVPGARKLADFLPPAGATTVAVDFDGTQRPVIAREVDELIGNPDARQLKLLPMTLPHDQLV